MNDLIKMTIEDFDFLENDASNAISIREEKYFTGDGELSAHGVCGKYLRGLVIHPYLAWTGEVYPKITVTKVNVEGGLDE